MDIKPNIVNGKSCISISGFTKDQQAAYASLIEFINQPYNKADYKRSLVGPAGTGKTYLVKALIKNCNLSYSTIGLATPTHKACRILSESISLPNIKVNTIQSDLGFRVNFDMAKFDINNPPFDPKGKIKIKDYRLYIVDEASMINRGALIFLENICKNHNCKILYIGDEAQLPPVGESYSAAFKGIKTCKLSQIVRQGDNNPISYLLELLRFDIKHKTFTFIDYISKNPCKFDEDNIKGYSVLNSSQFNQVVYTNFSDKQIERNTDFVKIIAYTNDVVSGWNKFVRNAIIQDADKSVITKNDLIISYTTIVNLFNEPIIKNSEEYIIKDVVNYIHPKYGIKGFMVKFTAIHGGSNTSPLFVLDHKDQVSVQRYLMTAHQLINDAKNASKATRAGKWAEYYKFKDSCLLLTNINKPYTNKVLYSRDLDYGFSLTAHKAQGSTFETTLVDVNNIVFDSLGRLYADTEQINRRLYVACSRAKNKLYLRYGK